MITRQDNDNKELRIPHESILYKGKIAYVYISTSSISYLAPFLHVFSIKYKIYEWSLLRPVFIEQLINCSSLLLIELKKRH